ncbi:MAG: TSUP family transporter [Hyphomicrobiaceae bacterium]
MIEIAGSTLDTTSVAVIVGATAIGGFLRGFVGFGGALALVPALALAVGPRVAVAVASLVGLPALIQLLPEAFRYADRRRVAPIALAILAAAPLGSLILTRLDQRIMTGAIGMIVMLLAVLTWKAPKGDSMRKPWVGVAAGAASGLLQGAAGIGGPPSVAVLMAQGGEPRQLRANVLATVMAISACGAISHLSFGLFTHKAIVMAAILLPVFVGFTWLGTRFFLQGGSRYFRAAALAILMGIGLIAVAGSLGPLILGAR